MKNIKLITFDLDDTFWDIKPVIIKAEKETREWIHNQVGEIDWGSMSDFLGYRKELIEEDASLEWDISLLRKKIYEKFSNLDSSIIIFLPARDLVSIIKEMIEFLGERQILIAKEITKIHENIIKGTLDNILDKVKSIILKGEVTIVLSSEANKNNDQNVDLNKEILDLTKKMKTADLAKYLSKKFKFSKQEIYKKILMLNKK